MAESGERTNPLVFVVGCPRSGTTLLQRMLDHHPTLAVANDTHFIPRVLEICGHGPDAPLSAATVEAALSYHRFHRLGLSADAVWAAAEGKTDYASFVAALYDTFAQQNGKRFAGEKTPDYVRRISLLATMFPSAQFIHIVRDGRDVALSALAWAHEQKGPGRYRLWQEHPVGVCALWWRRFVERGQSDGARLGPSRYREVHYDDLVNQTGSSLEAITRFLGLPYSDEMETFHVNKMKPGSGKSAKSAWLPATPGLRNWRSELPKSDVALFEALAGELLERLGYQRTIKDVPVETGRFAELCRHQWAEETRQGSKTSTNTGRRG